MKEKIIKNYIDSLSINDINKFAINHNIILNQKEQNYLYHIIKNHWHTIIFGNPHNVLNDLRKNFNSQKYQQIYQLYQTYKNKYSHYL